MARAPDPAVLESLTPREREVLELLRRGLTDREIAEQLGVSTQGATFHVSAIIRKLGVRNRYEASTWPERPPWWMAAFAPLSFVRRPAGAAVNVAALSALAAVVIGAGVMVYLLIREGSSEDAGELAIPQRPSAIESYPATIASYLNQSGSSDLGEPCLEYLFSVWQMPTGRTLSPGTSAGLGRCVRGNTDDDPEDEVVVSLSSGGGPSEPLRVTTAVLDGTDKGYEAAFSSPVLFSGVSNATLAASDLNGDGVGDLAFAEIMCGAHTCSWNVHVVTGSAETYRELTPSGGLVLATASISIEDTDGDGAKEIVMHGGIIESVGAGPQLARTDTYRWNGAQFVLVSSVEDPVDVATP